MKSRGNNVKNKKEQKLLGIKFDSFLFFDGHILSPYGKGGHKLHAVARIVSYTDLPKTKVLMKAFIHYMIL